MMKVEDFKSIEINNWLQLKDYNLPNWIYRGQRNSCWTFQSSLQRLCESMNIELKDAHTVEKILTSEFKRRFHQYSTYVPNPNDNLEWLSIMRHYRAPTRLLDWDYSIYIALYFALERECDDNEEGCAVWCLNMDWAKKETERKLREDKRFGSDEKNNEDVDKNWHRTSYGQDTDFIKRRFLLNFIDTAFPVNPSRITQRITAQKGLFLCPGNPKIPFDRNIESMDNFKDNIIKLLIPKDKHKRLEYLKNLYNLNINHAVLFPGLDGFAYSLSIYHHSFEKDKIEDEENPYICDTSVWDK